MCLDRSLINCPLVFGQGGELGIDTDVPGEYRPAVKKYMEERFGETQVCSVGTYTTLQIKQAINDVGKIYGASIPTLRRISKMIEDVKTEEDFLRLACRKEEIAQFVNKYPEMMNVVFLLLGQQKAASIHACAMMIFPKEKTMYEWCPVRKVDDLVISEWEGGEMDEAGFLKEDILGIEQLDKFNDILNLIEKNTGKRINLYTDIEYNDPEVYRYFANGWLSDIFQFSAKGLSSYTQKMKPKNMDDVIAALSLFRPGPMENGFHMDYIALKNGEKEPEYPIGTEEILKDTYSVWIYQEQIIKAVQTLAGFTEEEADIARAAIGKKKMDKIKKLRPKFVDGYVKRFGEKGVTKESAEALWEQMEKFGAYSFNRSHSASYAINAYNSLWLKVHYPLEFWSVALSRASKDDFPRYINEMNQTEGIEIKPVNINKSDVGIVGDKKSNSVYWALNATQQVGEKAQQQIIEERGKNGEYFSLEEFVDRHSFKGSSVNKSTVENLIYSGAFDEMDETREFSNIFSAREYMLGKYREKNRIKIDREKDEYSVAFNKNKIGKDWWWLLQQKNKSGFAFFDYKKLVEEYLRPKAKTAEYYDVDDLQNYDGSTYKMAMVGGYVLEVEEKESKTGAFASLLLENNYKFLRVVIFPADYMDKEEYIQSCKKNILLLTGKVSFDRFKEEYVIQANGNSQFIKLGV